MRSVRTYLAPSLVAVLLVALSGAFAVLAREVLSGRTLHVDERIMMACSPGDEEAARGAPWAEHLARDVTSLGSVGVVTLITLAACGYLAIDHRSRHALRLLACVSSGMLFYYGLKIAFERNRPELVSHLVLAETPSFPSGHAALTVLLWLSLAFFADHRPARRRLKVYLTVVAVVVVLAVSFSRIYLRVHWPTDVLGGWIAGVGWALVWWLVDWAASLRESRRVRVPSGPMWALGGVGEPAGSDSAKPPPLLRGAEGDR